MLCSLFLHLTFYSFSILENKHGKVSGGITVTFTDGTRKTHEFEFPPGTCTEQDNLIRVRKWVELLNDLRLGKNTAFLESNSLRSLSSQMRATQLTTSARQLSLDLVEEEMKSS